MPDQPTQTQLEREALYRAAQGHSFIEADLASVLELVQAKSAAEARAEAAEAELAILKNSTDARRVAAEAFKKWVHDWLDAVGVPHDPEPEYTKEHGCRISGRMRFLLSRATNAEAEVRLLSKGTEGLMEHAVASEARAEKAEAELAHQKECYEARSVFFGMESDKRFAAEAEVERLRIRQHCPTCDSPNPSLHPAMQCEGEVQPCRDRWHQEPTIEAENKAMEALLRRWLEWEQGEFDGPTQVVLVADTRRVLGEDAK